jgi:hypothetical protein
MLSDLSIRFVAREDHGRWLPLWEGYNAFYGRSGTTALSAAITRMTWARFFDAYEPVHALVAESGDQLLGLAHLHPPPKHYRDRTRLLSAGPVHQFNSARKRCREGPGSRRLPRGRLGWIDTCLLADARDEPNCEAPLRQGGRALRIRGLPQPDRASMRRIATPATARSSPSSPSRLCGRCSVSTRPIRGTDDAVKPKARSRTARSRRFRDRNHLETHGRTRKRPDLADGSNAAFCRGFVGMGTDSASLAMQKVEGSSPYNRSPRKPG